MCLILCPEIPTTVRVGMGSENLLIECSEAKPYRLSLSLPFPFPGFQNRFFSKVERKMDWARRSIKFLHLQCGIQEFAGMLLLLGDFKQLKATNSFSAL